MKGNILIVTGILFLIIKSSDGSCALFPKDISVVKRHEPVAIVGNPSAFVPGSAYTVAILNGEPFSQFMITSEADDREGSFQIIQPDLSTFSRYCLNTVTNVGSRNVTIVKVMWTAPSHGCVTLKGAMKGPVGWILSERKICSVEPKLLTTDADHECCACDDAKYKMEFTGIWSPETHPKDFPTSLWLTHFSDIIGATHDNKFSMWAEGQVASYGFKQLAEYGVVRELETELRNQSVHLRSIIKAAGLWHPNLNSKTYGVFRVDRKRHLLSFASMFGPTPDWVVGVYDLDLCTPNCSWIEEKEIDLLPYDAGTDSGISYMSMNAPTEPAEPIHKITSMYPEDPRSPFYDPSGQPIPSLARVRLTREKVIPKKCSDLTESEILEQVALTDNTEEENRPGCEVSLYSKWSPCSVSCGKGLRSRTRKYLNAERANLLGCNRQLVAKEMCLGEAVCPELEDEEVVPLSLPGECEVTDWGEWSDCSVTCGIGMIVRSRSFVNHTVHKKCMHISTMEKEKCMLPECKHRDGDVPPMCEVSDWSDWSPCSVSCGIGERVRIRHFKSQNPNRLCLASVITKEVHRCVSKAECQPSPEELKRICELPPDVGPCRGHFKKWSYDSYTGTCVAFNYGGCRGNKNNFNTYFECMKACTSKTPEDIQGVRPVNNGEPIDCEVSPWSTWSPCHPCLNGTKSKNRTILVHPQNGGKPCPSLSKTIQCSMPEEFCLLT